MGSAEAHNQRIGLAITACASALHKSAARFLSTIPSLALLTGPTQSLSLLLTLPLFLLTAIYSLFFLVGMPFKSSSALIFLLALTSSVDAQVVISPALGVNGPTTSANVRTASIPGDPCGGANITLNIDTSAVVAVNTSGIVSVDIVNFVL
jgi:hypothetical protein